MCSSWPTVFLQKDGKETENLQLNNNCYHHGALSHSLSDSSSERDGLYKVYWSTLSNRLCDCLQGLFLAFLRTDIFIEFDCRFGSFGKHLSKVITTSTEIQTLKKGALLVTQLTAGSFFIAYLPIVILFVIFTADPNLLPKIKVPYLMCLDFSVRLVFHLNSCIIPSFLVNSRTLSEMRAAASANASRSRSIR